MLKMNFLLGDKIIQKQTDGIWDKLGTKKEDRGRETDQF